MIQKFSEAALQMKPGDKFRVKRNAEQMQCDDFELYTEHNESYFKTKKFERLTLSVWHFEIEGKIIRAEPEVLTAKEILSKIDVKCSFFSDTSWVHVVDAIELSDKNGQIKEWKRLKPYIDALMALDSYTKITPPWEPEK